VRGVLDEKRGSQAGAVSRAKHIPNACGERRNRNASRASTPPVTNCERSPSPACVWISNEKHSPSESWQREYRAERIELNRITYDASRVKNRAARLTSAKKQRSTT